MTTRATQTREIDVVAGILREQPNSLDLICRYAPDRADARESQSGDKAIGTVREQPYSLDPIFMTARFASLTWHPCLAERRFSVAVSRPVLLIGISA